MNKVILVGRLTKEPELRVTPGGVCVCSFSVACNRRFVKQGEERKADFINCIAWRQTGEFVSKYFTKGKRIALEGSLQIRDWTDNEGKKHCVTEVVADNVEFAQSKNEQERQNVQSDELDAEGFVFVEDEDLPF